MHGNHMKGPSHSFSHWIVKEDIGFIHKATNIFDFPETTALQRYGVKIKTSTHECARRFDCVPEIWCETENMPTRLRPAGWLRWGAHVLVSVLPGHAHIRKMSGVFLRASSFLSASPLLIFIRIGLPRASPLAQCILKAQKCHNKGRVSTPACYLLL